jgi:hypothetical protein
MNEKSLLLLCFVVSTAILVAIRNRLKRTTFAIGFFVLPFLIYAVLLILIIALALVYGDK